MAKVLKKISLVILSFLMVLCIGFAFANNNKTSAATENTVAADLGQVTVAETSIRMEMIDGAYIRSEDPTGIRFVTYVSLEDYNALVATFGKDQVELGTELTANGVTNSIVAQKVTKVGEDILRYATVISEIPANMYGVEITAKSYVKVGEEKAYTANSVTRSIEDTAKVALSVPTSLDNATRVLFEGFAGVTDKTADAEIVIDASLSTTVNQQLGTALGTTVNYVFDSADNDVTSSVALTNEILSDDAGSKTLTVYTADGIVKVKALAATDIFYSKEDILAFAPIYKDNKVGQYYMLGANIDLEGTDITNYTGSTWNTGSTWKAIFDGQGYAISNASCTHGFFASVANGGVIKNMSLINISKASNGGGLISNGLTGKLENVFALGTITSGTAANQGGIAATVQPTTVSENVVALIEYTGAGLNAGYANLSSKDGSTMKNVIAISSKSTVLNSAPSVNVTNSKHYVNMGAYVADDFDTTSFGAGWELYNGLPILTNSKSAVDAYFNGISLAITAEEEIKTGSAVSVNSPYAVLSFKEDVDASIDANGIVTISSSVPTDSILTIVATLPNGKTVEKECIAKTITDKTSVSYTIDKSTELNILDLTTIDASLTDASVVSSMTVVNGAELSFAAEGSMINVDGASVTQAAGVDYLIDIATTSGDIYRISAKIATDILYNKEDVLAFAVNYINNKAGEYYLLGANIDLEGTDITNYTGSTWALANDWKAVFDGQGYALSNIAYTHGLFATMNTVGSAVKNLTVINAQKASNGGALIANTANGTIENVFLLGTIASGTPTAQAGIVANAYDSTVKNAVIFLDWTGAGSNTVFSANSYGGATATNVIGISAKSTGACAVGAATNVQNFATLGDFLASGYDTSVFGEGWELYNGLPILSNSKSALETYFNSISVSINSPDVISTGDAVTVSSAYVKLSIKESVNITINTKGVITFGTDIVDGSTFTVVATLPNGKTFEKVLTAKVIIDKTSYSLDILATESANAFDLTTIDASLTDASTQVVSLVTTNGTAVNYATEGSYIGIDGSNSGLTKGTEYLVDITTNTGIIYRVKAYVADEFINGKSDLITWYNKQYEYKPGTVVALNTNIDMAGDTSLDNETVNAVKKGATGTYGWFATFDGRGHVISNATYNCGFFFAINGYDASISKSGVAGKVKNFGLVNPTDTFAATPTGYSGLLAWRSLNGGVIENVYVKASNVNKCAGLVGTNGPGSSGHNICSISNSVVIIENTTGVTGGAVATCIDQYSCGKITNVYGVSTTRTSMAQGSFDTVVNSAVYTSVSALNTAGVAAATLDGVGPWSVVNGSLYFGNMEVGAEPTSVSTTYLVENGTSTYNVMVPDNYTQEEMDAALILTKYLKLSTGANLNICTESHIGNNPFISVGKTTIGKTHLAVSTANGFSIRTDAQNNYYLIGSDDYGTIFSTYEFLERFIGFDAIAVDEILYSTTSTLSHMNLTINETPSIPGRIVANIQGYTPGLSTSNDAYLFRYIHGHGEVNDPVINTETGNEESSMYYHTVFRYLNPEIYNNQAEYPEKYNPGWFSKANVQDISELQLCYTAHGDSTNYAVMQRKVLEVLWANVQANTKEKMNYSFSMYDNTFWCGCTACNAEYTKYGTHSAVVIKFANDLKTALDAKMIEARDYREVNIWIYAYLGTEVPPVTSSSNGLIPLDDNVKCVDGVGVVYAIAYADYTVPITDSNFNQISLVTQKKTNYYENLKRWAVLTDKLYVWMYGTSFKDYMSPYLTFDATQATMKELMNYGVDYVFFEGQHNMAGNKTATGFTTFKDYYEGKIMWNVNEDTSALTTKFFTNYFGPAATAMRAYYDSINAYWNDNNYHAHAFSKISNKWNKTAVAGWIQNIADAKTALSTALSNGTISQDRYNVLLNRVEIENIAVVYMNIVSGGNTTTAYKSAFKQMLDKYGYVEVGQGYTVEDFCEDYNIA